MHQQIKNVVFFISYLLMQTIASAQDSCYTCSRDSLLTELTVVKNPLEKIQLLQWIIDFDPASDSANNFIEQFITLNELHGLLDVTPYKTIHQANVYRINKENDLALQLYHKAVTQFDQQHKKIPNLLLGFRNLYNLLNKQEERYHYYNAKLDQYSIQGPFENTAACYHGIAGYFTYTADYNQAISYYLKAAEVFRKFYPYWYYNAMGIVGIYYGEWGNYSKALEYINLALPHIKGTKGVLETANGYYEYQLAQIKFNLKKFDEVLSHAHVLHSTFEQDTLNRFYSIGLLYKALALTSSGDANSAYPLLLKAKRLYETAHAGRMTTFNSTLEIDYGLFHYFNYLKEYRSAEKYLMSAYNKAVAEKTNHLQLKYLNELANVTALQGKFVNSRRFTETFFELKNKLEKEQAPLRIAQYENEQKHIEQLQKINVLQTEQAAQSAVIKRRNAILGISFLALLLIGTSMIFFYRQLQINKKTLQTLKQTQAQLIQSEKMASLGELTAGIAHEIQNPLNFVNNFSEGSAELADGLKKEVAEGDKEESIAIAEDIKINLEKIVHHGKRADAIVKGMLQHSRVSIGKKEPTNLNALADEYLKLAYHGLRAKDNSFNATLNSDYDESIGNVNIVPQDIGRVILNLITNAFYAVNERLQKAKASGDNTYQPTVTVTTKKTADIVLIIIKDNGDGIPQNVLDKVFQPFFTTKPTGEGTGLGLSLSYDIVKAHGGEITIKTVEGDGSIFTLKLPKRE